MANASETIARARISLAADARACWRAITDPEALATWYAERVEGELREGTQVRVSWESLGQALSLEVVAARPFRLLRLEAKLPGRPPQRQELTIRALDRGCEVSIEHSGFRAGVGGDDERAGTEAGWRAALAMLSLAVEQYPGRRRYARAALATANAPPNAAYRQLARVFSVPDLAGPGAHCQVSLGTRELDGEVLVAVPRYMTLVALPAIDGALALRAFPVGAAQAPKAAILTAQIWSFGTSPAAAEEVLPALEASLQKVVVSSGGPTAEA